MPKKNSWYHFFRWEKSSFLLWLPILFASGLLLYFNFPNNFAAKFPHFSALFCGAFLFSLLFRKNPRHFIFLAISVFVFGGCYAFLFENYFYKTAVISGKIYVEGEGKIIASEKFFNPRNQISGLKLLVEPQFLARPFSSQTNKIKEDQQNPRNSNQENSGFSEVSAESEGFAQDQINEEGEQTSNKIKKAKKAKKKVKKPKKKSEKKSAKKARCKKSKFNESLDNKGFLPDLSANSSYQNSNQNLEANQDSKTKPDCLKKPRKKRKKSAELQDLQSLQVSKTNPDSDLKSDELSLNEDKANEIKVLTQKTLDETSKNQQENLEQIPQKRKKSKSKLKSKKIAEATPRRFWRDFVNIPGFTDIDLRLLDQKNIASDLEWYEEQNLIKLANPPKLISIIFPNSQNQQFQVGDSIRFKSVLTGPRKKEFRNEFDFALQSKISGIGAYGFLIGKPFVIGFASDSNFKSWFIPNLVQDAELFKNKNLVGEPEFTFGEKARTETKFDRGLNLIRNKFFAELRESIDKKIANSLESDLAAIATALLTGNQGQISLTNIENIRNSGLAHLLSISGFHLSLAAMIFFVTIRGLLSCNEKISLRFDIKKIAAIFAIFGSFFYLQISGSPIPAQRAFIGVLLLMAAILLGRKFNSLRALMMAFLTILLINPWAIFSISLQLSFSAVLMLITYFEVIRPWLFNAPKINARSYFLTDFLSKIKNYLVEILVISLLIQTASLPFLLHHFHKIALLGFVANLLAIPLASFVIMPLGFLSLFLMPFGIDFLALKPMGIGIELLLKIAEFVGEIELSKLRTPHLSSFGLLFSSFGLLVFCLSRRSFSEKILRFLGVGIFLVSFFALEFQNQPTVVFAANQRFFAVMPNQSNDAQLFFSKPQNQTKQIKIWLQHFNQESSTSKDSTLLIRQCSTGLNDSVINLPESLPEEALKKPPKIVKTKKRIRAENEESGGNKNDEESEFALVQTTQTQAEPAENGKNSNFCQQCNSSLCILQYRDLSLSALIITGRNRVSYLCRPEFLNNFNLIVNFSRKYQLPSCLKQSGSGKNIGEKSSFVAKIIDNHDFLEKGNHLILPNSDKSDSFSFRVEASN